MSVKLMSTAPNLTRIKLQVYTDTKCRYAAYKKHVSAFYTISYNWLIQTGVYCFNIRMQIKRQHYR